MTGLHEVDEAVALLTRGTYALCFDGEKVSAQNAFFLDMVQEGNMGPWGALRGNLTIVKVLDSVPMPTGGSGSPLNDTYRIIPERYVFR